MSNVTVVASGDTFSVMRSEEIIQFADGAASRFGVQHFVEP